MLGIDWLVLSLTLAFIVVFGIWKSRKQTSLDQYLLGGNEASWWTVGLSVMATQASAITFISTPGQAYHDGMGFVQFYFGLPIAMVIICIAFIPIYKRLKVYTAYQYLETRFDLKTRTLTAILFLVQRGLAAGITIYAPSIILSTLFGWNLNGTIFVTGFLVIAYTLTGGTKAVNTTQKLQMGVIFSGLVIAFAAAVYHLSDTFTFGEALSYAASSDKMNILDFSFDLENRYTIWSGLIGGTFLALSYFGTDQSQVQRYLSSKSAQESQKGLIMNGLLKVPLQFFILLIGVLVFVLLQVKESPIFFNQSLVKEAHLTPYDAELTSLELQFADLHQSKAEVLRADPSNILASKSILVQEKEVQASYKAVLQKALPDGETNDKDYVFLFFVLNYLPHGIIGLLLAMIFSAAMSSTASELNALASTTTVDIYKRSISQTESDQHYVSATKGFTLMWGVIAISFACFGTLFENLIQFVNIIGSIFYGTILGVFIAAFFIKYIKSNAIFIAALLSESLIIYLWWIDFVPFLWLNLIGCLITVLLALLLQSLTQNTRPNAKLARDLSN